ncbi:nucleolar protein 10-like [Mizuhopecten yessoensis]|uniref:Nucleolar protein 10 n=1 Tax=Mizuhopecten yessoensis TaxID=6573 RepID=A0A210QYH3_MIZYE|nr:nucleolar protein 10-like [Mizuhopecten yessoensis]OWF53780.1 Nucleolar protein 10 [Mizuhopecten yessoensis]
MQVSNPNNVNIYNLSAGKSLPEWLSDRKRRALLKQDVDIRRRIELLQDFEMPTVSHGVQVTPDGRYICTTGTYKPRFRCYDVAQMSLKFERGLDSDVVKFLLLDNDYSKVVFLQCDRYIEFHSSNGRYYKLRIPKYGRDLAYHHASCDMYIGGVSSEVYRLNLEQGRFLNPLVVEAEEVNCCQFNPSNYLLACGTSMGTVECFDPRVRTRVGVLDIALSKHVDDLETLDLPAVTALKFRDGLNMAVGTSTGHVLLYDMRSDKPLLVKDHQYELPIKSIEFQDSMDLVLSMDTKILKLWNRETGKAFTSIEPGTNLNDLCLLPESGMLFMANEAPKILSYYIPTLGTAPKWCSFLDNMTEELEEKTADMVYDDYKFVTRKVLEDLGLAHLIGSTMLRAYMHGFFIDIRLYHRAKAMVEPFAYDEYRKKKIREKLEEDRANRVRSKKLPKVNRDLAEKLLTAKEVIATTSTGKKRAKEAVGLLEDNRFSEMFTKTDFQIDTSTEEYRLLNPVISKLDKAVKRKQQSQLTKQYEEVEEDDEVEGRASEDDSSSDDEHMWTDDHKREYHEAKRLQYEKDRQDRLEKKELGDTSQPRFYQLKEGQDANKREDKHKRKEQRKSLAERLESSHDKSVIKESGTRGNKEMTFRWKKSERESRRQKANKEHYEERKKLRRTAGEISKEFKEKPKYWMGKKVT